MSGGSGQKGLWDFRGRAITFSREVGTYGQVVEEVVLELSSQLCVQEKDELLGQP